MFIGIIFECKGLSNVNRCQWRINDSCIGRNRWQGTGSFCVCGEKYKILW